MTAQAFKNQILRAFYEDMHRIEQDNYAWARFSYDGVDRSRTFDVGKHAAYLEWFLTHTDELFRAWDLLADQESKDLYVNLLRYRLSGHLHVRINSRAATLADQAREFEATFLGTKSALPVTGMFGDLVHYDREWDGVRYTVDTLKNALGSTLIYKQYYFRRGDVVIEPEPGDHMIDGGCCTGDTTVVFSRSVGPAGFVHAFDPVQNHLDICTYNFARPGFENVSLYGFGLSDRSILAPPVKLPTYSPGWRSDGSPVPLIKIDDLFSAERIRRVDFIKLDVEGSELAALRGGEGCIREFRPKLAISIYHKPDDYFSLIDYIQGLGLGYRLFLDHHTIWDEETVLYAAVSNN